MVSDHNFVHMVLVKLLSAERKGHEWNFLTGAFDRLLEAGARVSIAGPDGCALSTEHCTCSEQRALNGAVSSVQ